MKRVLLIVFPICILLISCDYLTPRECEDVWSHDFNATEMEWFSYIPGDTIYYLNMDNGDTNYLVCLSEEVKDTLEYKYEPTCKEVSRTYYFQQLKSKFHTNFPHFEDLRFMNFNIFAFTSGDQYLTIDITLQNELSNYLYTMSFNNENESLNKTLDNYATPFSLGQIGILGKEYENVYAIPISDKPASDLINVCYDTIYYNKDGFLKFISSQYGYRLERLP